MFLEFITVEIYAILGICTLFLLRLLRRRVRRVNQAVIDGSNVMYWQNGEPHLDPLRSVVQLLKEEGYSPRVLFDANAGYLLSGVYLHDQPLAKLLNISSNHVMVVPKGQPADPLILQLARDSKGVVISNDRFRDWVDDFPEIREKGRLIRGGYRQGQLWLDLPHIPQKNA